MERRWQKFSELLPHLSPCLATRSPDRDFGAWNKGSEAGGGFPTSSKCVFGQ